MNGHSTEDYMKSANTKLHHSHPHAIKVRKFLFIYYIDLETEKRLCESVGFFVIVHIN